MSSQTIAQQGAHSTVAQTSFTMMRATEKKNYLLEAQIAAYIK